MGHTLLDGHIPKSIWAKQTVPDELKRIKTQRCKSRKGEYFWKELRDMIKIIVWKYQAIRKYFQKSFAEIFSTTFYKNGPK